MSRDMSYLFYIIGCANIIKQSAENKNNKETRTYETQH